MGQSQQVAYMRSCWRSYAYDVWGGLEWLSILLAVGDVPKECVDLMNEEVAKRVKEGENRDITEDRLDGARLSKRSAALRDQEEVPPVQGPTCKTSEPKRLREAAKALDKKIRSALSSGGPCIMCLGRSCCIAEPESMTFSKVSSRGRLGPLVLHRRAGKHDIFESEGFNHSIGLPDVTV